MFESIQMAPADPILGLTEAFNADANPEKINLSVGVYKDANGKTPILDCVIEAEKRLLASEKSKSYRPIHGAPDYGQAVQALLFGAGSDIIADKRAATAHTPGGTGALRVVGDYIHVNHPGAKVYLPDPTWANHGSIFAAAGVETATYPWFDPDTNGLAFTPLLEALKDIPAGSVILLHGCCQNPTGADPSDEQWKAIAETVAAQGLLPLVDFAYQGFAEGLEEDAAGLRAVLAASREAFICSSFSKNFGLYNERVGALTMVADNADQAAAVLSHVKRSIRTNYSNPPAHGGSIVTTILGDATLRNQWLDELAAMRKRINGMRDLFVKTLEAKGVPGDFGFIRDQRGMFSFSGLTKQQVADLRDKFAIYIVGSGRINVAGMTETNMDRLCEGIKAVV